MLKYFDTYTIKARIAPIFIVLLPVIINSSIMQPGVYFMQVITSSTIITLALSILGAQFSRDRGKRKEIELWKSWGGAPTTNILRHRNTDYNPIRRMQIHKNIRVMMPEITLPLPEEEDENPGKADEIYEACVKHLISKTRDTKQYPLLFKENVNYGFLRNLWGLKPLGILISLIGMGTTIVFFVIKFTNNSEISYEYTATILLNLALLLLWIFWVTPERIKIVAIAYAERLFECCE